MTRLSRYKLKSRLKEQLRDKLTCSFTKQTSRDLASSFLDFLLTPTEIETFAKRLEVLKLLQVGSTYWEIKEKVKVTNATITKMHNILEISPPAVVGFLENLINNDREEEHKEKERQYTKSSKQVYKRRL